MNPSNAQPVIDNEANGLNDAFGETKVPRGTLPFALNYLANGDTWDRRLGRDFFILQSGMVTLISPTAWQDGVVVNIAVIGTQGYDLTTQFTFLIAYGNRLIIQSPDLNYWDVTPNDSTGLINPTIVALPATPPQNADFTVQNGESFGFINSASSVVRLDADETYYGWYEKSYGSSTSLVTFTSDLVFTIASGYSFRIKDSHGNTWRLYTTNDGNLENVTV